MRPMLCLALSCVAALAACGSATAGPDAAAATTRPALDDVPRLTVRGNAELRKPADQLRLQIGVVTQASEATSALAENSQRMEEVVAALKKAGLSEDEYETGRFSLQPVYSRRPRQAAAEWRRHIVGYNVTNTISIRTERLDLAGQLIQAANEAGANQIDAISFALADPRRHRSEAIAAATVHAIADARTLADAASLRLVRILRITLDDAAVRPLLTLGRGAAMAAEVAATPPIAPGEVTVRASVTMVYEIAAE